MKQNQICLIRHGESEYNIATQQIRKKLNIQADWNAYLKSPQILALKYSQKMMDCSLSQAGQLQCKQLRQSFDFSNFDLIVVSPLYRTLMTANILLQKVISSGKDIMVVVDPVFGQSLRCACDISTKLEQAKEEFKFMDFTLVTGKESRWYLDHQNPKKKENYEATIKAMNLEQKSAILKNALGVLQHMKLTHEYEDPADLYERRKLMIQRLQKYSSAYSRICVISHYYSLLYLLSQSFQEDGKPLVKLQIENSKPYFLNLALKH